MFIVSMFFFLLSFGPANPFAAGAPGVTDGPGPNPLLQNHILVMFHPPMLYMGYVGFTVPFAFAIGALITGRVGEGWLLATRRWTLISWGLLTFGMGPGGKCLAVAMAHRHGLYPFGVGARATWHVARVEPVAARGHI
jgi:cytochrome c-type biogenesis protein CcmF